MVFLCTPGYPGYPGLLRRSGLKFAIPLLQLLEYYLVCILKARSCSTAWAIVDLSRHLWLPQAYTPQAGLGLVSDPYTLVSQIQIIGMSHNAQLFLAQSCHVYQAL